MESPEDGKNKSEGLSLMTGRILIVDALTTPWPSLGKWLVGRLFGYPRDVRGNQHSMTTCLQDVEVKKNIVEIDDVLAVEWKQPAASVADAPVDFSRVELGGRSVLRLSTKAGKGWLRLVINPAHTAKPVHALRLVMRIDGSAANFSVKPFIVETTLETGKRGEFPGAPGKRMQLKTGEWHDLSGAFHCPPLTDGRRADFVVDLPQGVDVLLADVSVDGFDAEVTPEAEKELRTKRAVPLADFAARRVEDLSTWLEAPAVFGSSIEKCEGRLRGWALTRAKTLYWADSIDGPRHPFQPAERVETIDKITLKHGFDFPLAPAPPESFSVMILNAEGVREPVWPKTSLVSQTYTIPVPKKSKMPRDRQEHVVLLWGPISISGLTIQLEQVAEILKRNKFNFRISYHTSPLKDHPLTKYWVDPVDIDQPKMTIFFERFVEFDRGFDETFKVFYMNLDWLSRPTLSMAKVFANVVLCPTPYRQDELTETFRNSKVVHLPWPSKFNPQETFEGKRDDKRIRILYVGNDYDESSRKHPFAVIEAIEKLERDDIVFDLKFRSTLPAVVRNSLLSNPRVDKLIDKPTGHDVIAKLYETADVNLIPNACEGNGLSILESWASGTIPAVLDGHPMTDVTSPENSFRIDAIKNGQKEYAPLYETDSDRICGFLDGLDSAVVQEKMAVVSGMRDDLVKRERDLEHAVVSCALMSGIRTKGLRLRVEHAHMPSKGEYWKPRSGSRVKKLMFSDSSWHPFRKEPDLVDVMMTTSKRPWCLRESFKMLLESIHSSPYRHRLMLAVDTLDQETLSVIAEHASEIDHVVWTNSQHGLPYLWNSMLDLVKNITSRTEERPDYVCYIQDDCLIRDPSTYFSTMVGIAHEAMPGYLGYVSGYFTEVHPGFADFDWNGERVVASDTVDGKNFMATPEVLASVGRLPWWFDDGSRRGNPGPHRGSHFDLWQWKESPNSLLNQNRISLVLPDLCDHIAQKSEESTWKNDTTDSNVKQRVAENRVYMTREY